MVFKGHRKAVSYAKFVSGEEIVSAWVLLPLEGEFGTEVSALMFWVYAKSDLGLYFLFQVTDLHVFN